jgi:hypothetical protein
MPINPATMGVFFGGKGRKAQGFGRREDEKKQLRVES